MRVPTPSGRCGAKRVFPPEAVSLRPAAQVNGSASPEHREAAWAAAQRLLAGYPDWRI